MADVPALFQYISFLKNLYHTVRITCKPVLICLKPGTGADPGFFLGGHLRGVRVRTPCTLPLDPPLRYAPGCNKSSVVTPKKHFSWEPENSENQVSQNYILHIKFSEFYLCNHNSCEISFSRTSMRNFLWCY